jgi:membrane protein
MRRLANNENGGLLTFGVGGALWSSSAALVSIVGALNRVYDIEEGRPLWTVRLIAIGLTLGVAAIVCGTLVAGTNRTHARRETRTNDGVGHTL